SYIFEHVRNSHATLLAGKVQRTAYDVLLMRDRQARGNRKDGIHLAGVVQIVGRDERGVYGPARPRVKQLVGVAIGCSAVAKDARRVEILVADGGRQVL